MDHYEFYSRLIENQENLILEEGKNEYFAIVPTRDDLSIDFNILDIITELKD